MGVAPLPGVLVRWVADHSTSPVVRSMALGEISGRRAMRLVLREVALGLAMFGNMLMAGLVGAGVPLLLRRFRLDPALSSSVVVTTFTDVTGFVLFLGLAAILMGLL